MGREGERGGRGRRSGREATIGKILIEVWLGPIANGEGKEQNREGSGGESWKKTGGNREWDAWEW